MDARRSGSLHVLRLDRGESLLDALQAYIGREGIAGGSVVGIGALERSELGWFDRDRREYVRRVFPEPRELLNLTGTISRLDGRPFVHAHATLGGPAFDVVGGHLFAGTIAVTGELVIREATVASRRAPDEATGLKLLQFDDP
jgi:hypothetical protein